MKWPFKSRDSEWLTAGWERFVDLTAVMAMFELNTRAADAIGIPLEAPSVDGRNGLAKRFGFDARAGGFAPQE